MDDPRLHQQQTDFAEASASFGDKPSRPNRNRSQALAAVAAIAAAVLVLGGLFYGVEKWNEHHLDSVRDSMNVKAPPARQLAERVVAAQADYLRRNGRYAATVDELSSVAADLHARVHREDAKAIPRGRTSAALVKARADTWTAVRATDDGQGWAGSVLTYDDSGGQTADIIQKPGQAATITCVGDDGSGC